jgi:membrane fusion protein, multidrug efflux system
MPKHILSLASLICLPLVAVACSSSSNAPAGAAAGGPGGRGGRGAGGPVPVVTAKVEQKAVPITIPAVGTVEAISTVQIRAQVTGQLGAIHFSEGQEVRKGQPLFSLDPRSFQAALQQAQAVLARDTATLQNTQAQQARLESLFQRGIISRDQFDTQRATAAAQAATVEADKAAVETARLNVQYTEITAPADGRTGGLGVHVGDLVRANDTTPMVIFNQLSPVYVTFSVPGRFLGDIRRFQAQKPLAVTATPSAGTSPAVAPAAATPTPGGQVNSTPAESDPARGAVSFIDNAVDATTGTIKLKGTFQNGDHRLWPGSFVQVLLTLTTDPNALVVPATAVQASQEGQFIYVVKTDRTVEMRPVTVDRQQGDLMVIARGVSNGETVVTDGQLRLVPGARIAERGEMGRGPAGAGGAGGTGGTPGRGGRRGGE